MIWHFQIKAHKVHIYIYLSTILRNKNELQNPQVSNNFWLVRHTKLEKTLFYFIYKKFFDRAGM